MLRQFLVSIAVSFCNIAIHAIVMTAVLWAARVASERTTSHQSLRLIAVMTATVSVLMAAHIWLVDRRHFCGPAEHDDDKRDRRGTAKVGCIFRVIHSGVCSREVLGEKVNSSRVIFRSAKVVRTAQYSSRTKFLPLNVD